MTEWRDISEAPIDALLIEECAKAICDVIWPLADWDGEHSVAHGAAQKAAQAAASIFEREMGEMREVLAAIVSNANEAMPFGPFDQIDNCGEAYQSQAFHDALDRGRKCLARAALSKEERATQDGGSNDE